MSDHLGIFGQQNGETGDVDVDELRAALAATPAESAAADKEQPRKQSDEERAGAARRRHRRWLVFAVVVLLIIVGGLVTGFVLWRSTANVIPDYAGTGDTEVVVRVQSGDGIADIADTLAAAGVVASAEAFQNQAALDADVQALRPGYYRVQQNASARATADALVAKENRVGHVRLVPGRQLADVSAVSTDPNVAPVNVPG